MMAKLRGRLFARGNHAKEQVLTNLSKMSTASLSTIVRYVFCSMLLSCNGANAQDHRYAPNQRLKTLSEFAWASGHYFPDGGDVVDRKWIGLGIGSEWKLAHFAGGALKYEIEFKPLVLVSNLTQTNLNTGQTTLVERRCPIPPNSINVRCGSRWDYAQQLTPLGLQENFGSKHRLQPFLSLNAGYLYSNRQIPMDTSGNFHFTIAVGGGVEYFDPDSKHSLSLEAQAQHYSNAYTATTNYGTDNVFLKASYRFGWRFH